MSTSGVFDYDASSASEAACGQTISASACFVIRPKVRPSDTPLIDQRMPPNNSNFIMCSADYENIGEKFGHGSVGLILLPAAKKVSILMRS